jgi:hypothetical protein
VPLSYFQPGGPGGAGAIHTGGTETHLLRVDLSGWGDGVKVGTSNSSIVDTWCHNLFVEPGFTHNDCVHVNAGSNLTFRGNRFEAPLALNASNAAIFFPKYTAAGTSAIVEGNYFEGGAYTLFQEAGSVVSRNNTFGPFIYGPWYGTFAEWTGNVRGDGAGGRWPNGGGTTTTTVAPTTVAPTTLPPTTVAPTTIAPTTLPPTTVAPTTVAPTTTAAPPTTAGPIVTIPASTPIALPSFRGSSQHVRWDNKGHLPLPFPTGARAGDLLVAVISVGEGVAPRTVPAGWTRHDTTTALGGNAGSSTMVFSKLATASEPATYTFDFACSWCFRAGTIVAYNGVSRVASVNGVGSTYANRATSTIRTPGSSTPANAIVLSVAVSSAQDAPVPTFVSPAGWTYRTQTGATTSWSRTPDRRIAVAESLRTTAGSTSDAVWGSSSSWQHWTGQQIVLTRG